MCQKVWDRVSTQKKGVGRPFPPHYTLEVLENSLSGHNSLSYWNTHLFFFKVRLHRCVDVSRNFRTNPSAKRLNAFVPQLRAQWWVWWFLPKLHLWTIRSRHLHSNFCDIRGYHGKALLWEHLCGRGLALSLLQAPLCGNRYTWKGCFPYYFLGTRWKMFLIPICHKHLQHTMCKMSYPWNTWMTFLDAYQNYNIA